MAPKAEYLYFNVRARGELPRLVCAAGGIEITDTRIGFESWPTEYKPKTPYGQLPCVIVNGQYFGQKLPISIYFARQCGLYPTSSNPLDLLKIDSTMQYTEDILEQIVVANAEKAFGKGSDSFDKMKAETLPAKLPIVEKIIKDNGTGFIVGSKLSVADLSCFDVAEHVRDNFGADMLAKFPSLKAHFEKVAAVPGIKKYTASRPPPMNENFVNVWIINENLVNVKYSKI